VPDPVLTPLQRYSIIGTVVLFLASAIVASWSAQHQSVLWLAASAGALGGLVHELAQSGGKILFFRMEADGLYLGSIAGMVLGSVAGVLVVRGHLTGSAPDENMVQLAYEVFTAGLALKGVVEAAGGNVVPKG